MAEALTRHYLGERVEAGSAGLAPLGYIPSFTLQALNEAGISTDGLYSKGLGEVELGSIDCLVSLVEFSVEPFIPGHFSGKIVSCPVRDPFGQDIESYRAIRDTIERLVRQKLPELI
jgi:protein-tyrosine-phosphatase